MATKSSKFSGLARRLKNAGLKVSRSDRSETIYVCCGKRELRISGHELGVADYGSRQQKHVGPEVVVSADQSPAEIIAACLEEVRQYMRDYAGCYTESERSKAAATLRSLRSLAVKLS